MHEIIIESQSSSNRKGDAGKAKKCLRKINIKYLKYGFVFSGTEDEP